MTITNKIYGQAQSIRFQFGVIWGGNPPRWQSGRGPTFGPVQVPLVNPPVANDSPVSGGNPYTGAWYLDATTTLRTYRNGDDPTDLNTYLDIELIPNHNKIWTSHDDEDQGYIDIGALYVKSDDCNLKNPDCWCHDTLYLSDADAARKQLEGDIINGFSTSDNAKWVVGVLLDNGSRTGWALLPGDVIIYETGSFPYADGADNTNWSLSETLTLSPSDFDQDGKLIINLPYYLASRSRHSGASYPDDHGCHKDGYTEASWATSSLSKLWDVPIDEQKDLFNYIPWAVLENNVWLTCDRRTRQESTKNDGLQSMTASGWETKYITNSSLNPNVPGDSNGFRVNGSGSLEVSPKTPPTN